jgi:AAA15 family ATPase/GTPase
MLIIFVQDTIKYEYEIIFNQDCIIEEKLFYYPKSRKSAFFLRKTDIVNKLSYITWGETAKLTKKNADIIEGNTIWNEPVLAALNKSNMTVDMLSNVQNWFKQYLQMMIAPNVNVMNWASNMVEHLPQYKSMMTAFLKKADIQIDAIEIVKEKPPFDLREATMELVQEIDLPSTTTKRTTTKRTKIPMDQVNIIEQKTLFFHHPIKNKDGSTSSYPLHWELESLGTRHYFGLTSLLTMLMTSKHLCSIDEIDTSLHPDLMKHFILTFLTNAKQSQLIVTTHNISFLENQDILRKDVIKFTEKKEDGSTELYALSDFDPAIFRKNPSFLTAYKIGKLGAKPNLGDYYLEVENEQK